MKKFRFDSEERCYSEVDLKERYYSENELDELLEAAFSYGYEEGQREFAAKYPGRVNYDDSDVLKKMKDSDILAERKRKGWGRQTRNYNNRLKEAKYQARRREARDWKMNNVQRDGYSY